MRDAARRILESGDFAFGPRADLGVWQWIWRKIQAFFDALAALRETAPALTWVIVGACVLVLAAILAHAWIVLSRTLRAAKAKAEGPEAAARREKARQLLASARESAAAGDIARALSLYMRAVLVGLDERGLQRQTETATAREYLSLLTRHPQEHRLLEQFLRFYEPGVFGRRAFGPEPLRECDHLARRLVGEPV